MKPEINEQEEFFDSERVELEPQIFHVHLYPNLLLHYLLTKEREPVLVGEKRDHLFRYIWGVIKNKNCILNFSNWQNGYGAFTHSRKDRDNVIEYIKNQQERHRQVSFIEELRNILIEAGIDFDKKYLL